MAGLDPAIHAARNKLCFQCGAGWPEPALGLDPRVKPGHDNGRRFAAATAGLRMKCGAPTTALAAFQPCGGARPQKA